MAQKKHHLLRNRKYGDEANENAGEAGNDEEKTSYSEDEITEFSMFITMPGSEINDDNEIAQMIAERYGVK